MVLLLLLAANLAAAEDLPRGQVLNDVKCAADPDQSYALYLPTSYAPDRASPVIFAFDPGARGRVPVERYQAAAEQYGYIVAGSNKSRNGSWEVSQRAARAMFGDVSTRFLIDQHRIYTAGMSGGSRVAMGVAMGSNFVAGVIASSAGFPDSNPRKKVAFAVFGTAGTEDFNLMEMRRMDRALTSPHRLAVFEGGHVWLSSEIAMQAVEWMEIQAAKTGAVPGEDRIARIFEKRVAAMEAMTSEKDRHTALESIVADFQGLRDVSAFAARAAELSRNKEVRAGIKKERDEEIAEEREIGQILTMEGRLKVAEQRREALADLHIEWQRLAKTANGVADTPERRTARRVMRGLAMGAADRVNDPEYLKTLQAYRGQR
jgi:poly(3-hydroxybutyrate) depolymerase